ncbi:MAG: hypothetical protein HY645_00260 [Acidobacteria bacterium]|nr:hypothetical protein [Acidobacteriota bacterium]
MLELLSSGLLEGRIAELANQLFPQIKTALRTKLPEAATKGHLNALKRSVVPEPILEELEKFCWSLFVLSSAEEQLILGDAAPIMLTGEGKFRAMADKSSDVEAIYLPISPHCFVFGSRHEDTPAFRPAEFNQAMARCSGEYFVSSTEEAGYKYASQIAGTSFLFSPAEHEILLDEVLFDLC